MSPETALTRDVVAIRLTDKVKGSLGGQIYQTAITDDLHMCPEWRSGSDGCKSLTAGLDPV